MFLACPDAAEPDDETNERASSSTPPIVSAWNSVSSDDGSSTPSGGSCSRCFPRARSDEAPPSAEPGRLLALSESRMEAVPGLAARRGVPDSSTGRDRTGLECTRRSRRWVGDGDGDGPTLSDEAAMWGTEKRF